MQRFTIILWGFLVMCASAGALGYYAVNSAPDKIIGGLYLLGVCALLSAEFAIPHQARARWAAGEKGAASIMVCTLITVVAVVVAMDIGFMAMVSDHGRASNALDAARNRAIVQAAEKPLRPVGVIRADVADIERRNPGIRGEWCHDKKDAMKRETCDAWSTMRGELETAEAVARLTIQGGTEADARAALIARWLGGSARSWSDVLALIAALALSLCRVALSLAIRPVPSSEPAEVARAPTPKTRRPTRPALVAPAAELIPENAKEPGNPAPGKLSRAALLRFARATKNAA